MMIRLIALLFTLVSFQKAAAFGGILLDDCQNLSIHLAEVAAEQLAPNYFHVYRVSPSPDKAFEDYLDQREPLVPSEGLDQLEISALKESLDAEYAKLFREISFSYSHLCSLSSLLRTSLGSDLYSVEFSKNNSTLLWELAAKPKTKKSALEEFQIFEAGLKQTNKNYSYCIRDMRVIDKITIHHTDTPDRLSAREVNQIHLNMGFAMVGYHYLLQANYKRATKIIRPRAFYGRYANWVGGHNGAELNAYNPMYVSKNEVKISDLLNNSRGWGEAEKYLKCFFKTKNSEKEIKLRKYFKRYSYMTENVRSLGIGVIGSFYQGKEMNPETLNALAKLICAIKKDHPQIRYVDVHRDTRRTKCPGHIHFQLVKLSNEVKKNCEGLDLEFPYL